MIIGNTAASDVDASLDTIRRRRCGAVNGIRDRLGLSCEEFAERTGISVDQVRRWRNATAIPSDRSVTKLLRMLHVEQFPVDPWVPDLRCGEGTALSFTSGSQAGLRPPSAETHARAIEALKRYHAERALAAPQLFATLTERGWTPEALCEELRVVHRHTVRRWFDGRAVPQAKFWRRIVALVESGRMAARPVPGPYRAPLSAGPDMDALAARVSALEAVVAGQVVGGGHARLQHGVAAIGDPPPLPKASTGDDPLAQLAARWSRLFDAMRSKRDLALAIVMELEERLVRVELALKLQPRATPALERMIREAFP